ncbi:MAG TPA: hypothetical protein VJR02_18705 [Pyrinomonadaceae bacterium]|nr:hypothetical protein [Pyrinomonadaceae bacterium]
MKIMVVVVLCLLTVSAAVTPKDIKPLQGAAPYGVEKRPMPSGLEMDDLLPKKVGPYTRMSLEKSEHRGVTPTRIDVNGESIYAVYRVGPKEVFVEFSVSTSPKTAQEILLVAARDTSGKFPKDPRVGSIGTEPSYLRVNKKSGAFFGWTRGKYYYSASAKGGDADLDAFMQGFPY